MADTDNLLKLIANMTIELRKQRDTHHSDRCSGDPGSAKCWGHDDADRLIVEAERTLGLSRCPICGRIAEFHRNTPPSVDGCPLVAAQVEQAARCAQARKENADG